MTKTWTLTRACVRLVVLVLLSAVVLLAGRPVFHVLSTIASDRDSRTPSPAGTIDDASRLMAAPVAEVWPVPADPAEAEAQLRAVLARARDQGLPVSIAGSRHSMGGHTIAPGGIVVDMRPFDRLELDVERRILLAGAGATWAKVVPLLDAHGLSVAVMQSNNSFSVGGSVSVNCHGWQTGRPPIASTVESLRVMLADGRVVRCSRADEPELFRLVLGGYGLFGIILDVELRVVPNETYRVEQRLVAPADYAAAFGEMVAARPEVHMAYGRIDVTPETGFDEALITTFVADGGAPAALAHPSPAYDLLARAIFRGSEGSDYGKALRWRAERDVGVHLAGGSVSRNSLLDEGVETYENRSDASTDILHEYFVPRDRLAPFLEATRRILAAHGADLLNITIRDVEPDTDTCLAYARVPSFGLVMLFTQKRTPEGERRMEALTHELIDAAAAEDGTYYLPYRLHATREQFARAYPQSAEFFAAKRKYDPEERFVNELYLRYGS